MILKTYQHVQDTQKRIAVEALKNIQEGAHDFSFAVACVFYVPVLCFDIQKELAMEAATTTIRLAQDTLKRLDLAAESLHMTRTAVINKAVNQFLDYDAWFRAEVQKGIDADNAGEVVTTAEVKARLRARGLAIE